MTKIIPNGSKIAELRRTKEMKQEDFASRVGMSVRKLRDIETKNHTISPTELAELADKLGASVAGLTNSNGQATTPSSNQVQLRPVTGRQLFDMMRWAEDMQHEIAADIQTSHLEAVLDILHVGQSFASFNNNNDQFPTVAMLRSVGHIHEQYGTPGAFEDVKLIAALNELMDRLRQSRIGTYANTYKYGLERPFAVKVAIAFADADQDLVNIEKDELPF